VLGGGAQPTKVVAGVVDILVVALAAVARDEAGVVAGTEELWMGIRWGTRCSRSFGVNTVAARWCGTAVMCGCRGRLHIHWSGSCSCSNGVLHWSTCSVRLGLGG